MLSAADVHGRRLLRIRLRRVDVGPRGRVENEVDRRERRRRQRDVPLRMGQPARAGERLEQRRAELAGGAGYDDVSRSDRIGDVVLQK